MSLTLNLRLGFELCFFSEVLCFELCCQNFAIMSLCICHYISRSISMCLICCSPRVMFCLLFLVVVVV